MMLEAPAPIDHKEYNERKRKVHRKKRPSARAILQELASHTLAGCVFSRMSNKEEAHNSKQKMVCSERGKPEGVVIDAEPQLKNSVKSVPRERAVERDIYAQSGVILPSYRVSVLIFEFFYELYKIRYSEAPYSEGIGRDDVGKDSNRRLGSYKDHRADEQYRSEWQKEQQYCNVRIKERSTDSFPFHLSSS